MNTHEAYAYQVNRLTEEEKIQVNMKESNIGRRLASWEICTIFKLEPSGNIKPKQRNRSEDQSKDWMD